MHICFLSVALFLFSPNLIRSYTKKPCGDCMHRIPLSFFSFFPINSFMISSRLSFFWFFPSAPAPVIERRENREKIAHTIRRRGFFLWFHRGRFPFRPVFLPHISFAPAFSLQRRPQCRTMKSRICSRSATRNPRVIWLWRISKRSAHSWKITWV